MKLRRDIRYQREVKKIKELGRKIISLFPQDIQSKIERGIQLRPQERQSVLKILQKTFYPKHVIRGKAHYVKRQETLESIKMKRTLKRLEKKREKIIDLFRNIHGDERLGMMIIRPELFGYQRTIEEFIKKTGAKILFKKDIVQPKTAHWYRYRKVFLEDSKLAPNFPQTLATLTFGPIRVVVFAHQPKEKYIKKAKELGIKINPKEERRLLSGSTQSLYKDLFVSDPRRLIKNTLRGDIVQDIFREKEFQRRIFSDKDKLYRIAFDPTGILKELRKSMPDVVSRVYSGVHCPAGKKKYEVEHKAEIYNEASIILSRTDLNKISRKLKELEK